MNKEDLAQVSEDMTLLRQLVAKSDELDAIDAENAIPSAFRDMLSRMETGRQARLSERQRAWARSIAERVLGTIHYENLASSGKLVRGREVETPAVLQNLPKKPPTRKAAP